MAEVDVDVDKFVEENEELIGDIRDATAGLNELQSSATKDSVAIEKQIGKIQGLKLNLINEFAKTTGSPTFDSIEEANKNLQSMKSFNPGDKPPSGNSPFQNKLNDLLQKAGEKIYKTVDELPNKLDTLNENAKTNSWLRNNLDLIFSIFKYLSVAGALFWVYEDLKHDLTGCYQYMTVNNKVQKTKNNSCAEPTGVPPVPAAGVCACPLVDTAGCPKPGSCTCAPIPCGGSSNVNYVWETPSLLDLFSDVLDAVTHAVGDGFSNLVSPLLPSGIFKDIALLAGGLVFLFILFKIFEHYMSENEHSSVIKLEGSNSSHSEK